MQLTFMMWCNVIACSDSASRTTDLTGLKILGNIGEVVLKV